jgi:8-oxo-dGTP pyrophosphatase MutT (NUDIX family)
VNAQSRPFIIPDDPTARPWRHRSAARVIIIDDQERILLFRDTDPGYPQRSWWVTPGGGIDPGETEEQAAVREVAEETGHRITEADLYGPVARRRVQHGYSDQVLDQTEAFFLTRVTGFEVDVSDFTEEEKITMAGHRWWSWNELAETREWIWPKQLLRLIRLGERPDIWPLDLGLITDESTRPVDSTTTSDGAVGA